MNRFSGAVIACAMLASSTAVAQQSAELVALRHRFVDLMKEGAEQWAEFAAFAADAESVKLAADWAIVAERATDRVGFMGWTEIAESAADQAESAANLAESAAGGAVDLAESAELGVKFAKFAEKWRSAESATESAETAAEGVELAAEWTKLGAGKAKLAAKFAKLAADAVRFGTR